MPSSWERLRKRQWEGDIIPQKADLEPFSRVSLLLREYQGSVCVHAKSLQSCLTLCDPMDYSPPGASVHGIPQA